MAPRREGSPVRRFLRSFVYAARGLTHAVHTQRNFRIHVLAAAVALLSAVWLRFSPEELALVVLLCAAVLAVELVNTAIEAVVDLATPDQHPLAAAAKDTAAAAVLVVAAAALVIGVLLYVPKLM